MNPFVQTVVCLLGAGMILTVIRSGCKIALVNLPSSEIVTRTLSRTIYGLFRLLNRKKASPESRQKIMYWFGPVFLLSCIATYFIITMFGFALIYWVTHAEPTWWKSFISSGSALSTLGFYTPSSSTGQVLAIIEGAVGLGIVVFLITFVPGYQSTIQQREEMSSRLYARTHGSPDCEAFYAWASRSDLKDYTENVWNRWEDFLRTIGDTHSESPVLVFTPSSRLGQSWVVSVFTIMDAANMAATTLQGQGRIEAAICLEAGIKALRMTAESLPGRHHPESPEHVTRQHYDALCGKLAEQGYVLEQDREKAWMGFINNRSRYEQILVFLSATLFINLKPRLLHLNENTGRRTDNTIS